MAEKDSSDDESREAALSLWQLQWLHVNRQQLIADLQLFACAIADFLVSRGEFDPLLSSVYQYVTSDKTPPVCKARKLLDWLLTRPVKSFWNFQRAIREVLPEDVGRKFMVVQKDMEELCRQVEALPLCERVCLRCGESVLKARKTLQRSYSSQTSLGMTGGLGKGKVLSLDKIFVNISLLSSEALEELFKKRSFS